MYNENGVEAVKSAEDGGRRMKKCIALFLLLLCLLSRAGAEEIKIAFSIHDLSTARSVAIAEDVIESAQARGWSISMRNAALKITQQISDIEEMLEQKPDYLVISAVKSIGLRDVIAQAAGQGVKVILVEGLVSDAKDGDLMCSIGIDAEAAGAACARVLADYFQGAPAKILEIQGTAGSWQSYHFAKGFRDAMCECENMQISGVIQGKSSRQDTRQALLEYIENLSEGQGFDAIFGHGDEEGIGAVNSYLSMKSDAQGVIPIVCVGGHDDVMRALAGGRLYACVQFSPQYGELVAEAIEKDMQGLQVESCQLMEGTAMISGESGLMRGY